MVTHMRDSAPWRAAPLRLQNVGVSLAPVKRDSAPWRAAPLRRMDPSDPQTWPRRDSAPWRAAPLRRVHPGLGEGLVHGDPPLGGRAPCGPIPRGGAAAVR